MPIQSLNPATGEVVKQFTELTEVELEQKIELAARTFETWKLTSFVERAELLKKIGVDLRTRKEELGKIITLEMGRPITMAMAEVEKCAWVCDYYAEEGEKLLVPELIATDATESGVRFDPLGVVLAVMPWNFPFWQVMRFAAPALMAGNVGLLKHASSVPQCAFALEELFVRVGFPRGCFQTLLVGIPAVETIVSDSRVAAATLTGSEKAGISLGQICGREIKPVVLELGGSDPYIVLADADVRAAADLTMTARFQNAGQSCISAKRFIVVREVAEQFTERVKEVTQALVVGDPMNPGTQMGPLFSEQGLKDIQQQLQVSVAMGAQVVVGGNRKAGVGFFFEATVVIGVTPDMPVWKEETFGPVLPILIVENEEEAIQAANRSRFGLGAVLWTQDLDKARSIIPRLEAGAVFVNGMVKSDPRLPFGGIKKSGLGRELGEYGIKSFVNVKTFWIK